MLISFLKKENDDDEQSKFMGKGDIIFLFVLSAIIGGVWYYYKSTKEETYNLYAKCEVLYFADNLSKAKECYEEDALKLNYRTDSLDSIGSNRIEKIESLLVGDTLFQADSINEAKRCYEKAFKLGADSIINRRIEIVNLK
jgi:tetratricopeptide (TPR) repeat protein